MRPFVYNAQPARVVFDVNVRESITAELRRLDVSRALVLSTPGQAGDALALATAMNGLAAAVFTDATMHTPVDVTVQALNVLHEQSCDALVAVGGGSTIGLAKALALRTGLPQVVIPTTYAGSEATPIVGETCDGLKTTQRSPKVLPRTIIYDVDLTLGLPVGLSATSGLNAIAHAVEALYARDASPVVSMIATDGIEKLARALPRIVLAPDDRAARSDALYGAWACGSCLGAVGMALHHKLCHVLGGSFGLPHSETHAVLLPQVVAFNHDAAPDVMARVARAIGAPRAGEGLFDLTKSLGAPVALREIGMPEAALERAVDLAMADPYWNPRPVDRRALSLLLEQAYHGRRPGGGGSLMERGNARL